MWLNEPITIDVQMSARRAGGQKDAGPVQPLVRPPVSGLSNGASTGPTSRYHNHSTTSAVGRHSTNRPGIVCPIVRVGDR